MSEVPRVSAVRQRACLATVEGVDLGQRAVRVSGTGELARCLQHETDHLHGELFIDRLDPSARGAVMRKIANLA